MKTYAGIDLHSSNNFIGVINAKDKKLYSKRHHNLMPDILKALGKFKATLQGVVVESTYNWYWLVDGLMDHGFPVGGDPYRSVCITFSISSAARKHQKSFFEFLTSDDKYLR